VKQLRTCRDKRPERWSTVNQLFLVIGLRICPIEEQVATDARTPGTLDTPRLPFGKEERLDLTPGMDCGIRLRIPHDKK